MAELCTRCGAAPRGITHVCPPPSWSSGLLPATAIALPMRVSLPAEKWSQIVFAAKESSDARLAQLIEQTVMEARVD